MMNITADREWLHCIALVFGSVVTAHVTARRQPPNGLTAAPSDNDITHAVAHAITHAIAHDNARTQDYEEEEEAEEDRRGGEGDGGGVWGGVQGECGSAGS
jgi:ssRNA-specific RNase YbeY (16S rRNA maturation enzyme)